MLCSRFDDLKQIVGLLRSETPDQPLVKNQQIDLLVGFDRLLEFIGGFCIAKLIKKLRHPYVPDCQMLPASRFSKSAGKICLSVSARTFENYVMLVLDVLAGREQSEILSAQLPILVVFDTFNSGVRYRQSRVMKASLVLVLLSPVPLSVDKQSESVLK